MPTLAYHYCPSLQRTKCRLASGSNSPLNLALGSCSILGYFEPIFPHVPDLSCCLGYRLQLPLEAHNESDSMVCHQVTVSIAVFVSDQARVIVEFAKLLSKKLHSFAIALEVTLSK